MTAIATEASTLTDGMRVRITDGPRVGAQGSYLASLSSPGNTCCGGAHQYAVRMDDGDEVYVREVEPVETPAPVLVVGQRVRVSAEPRCWESARHDGEPTGYVAREFYGVQATVVRTDAMWNNVEVRHDNGGTNVIAAEHLTPLPAEQAQPDRQPGEFRNGDRVTTTNYGPGTVVLPAPGAPRPGSIAVQRDGQSLGGFYGGGVFVVPTDTVTLLEAAPVTVNTSREFAVGDRVVIATPAEIAGREHVSGSSSTFAGPLRVSDFTGRRGVITRGGPTGGGDSERGFWYVRLDTGETGTVWNSHINHADAAATESPRRPEPVVVNPIAVGTEIMVDGRRAVVVDKADEWFRSNYGPSYQRHDRYVGYTINGSHGITQVTSVIEVVDTSALTVEQKLARLEVLIHRVASYEAVRREWCSEVNTALAPLGLPEHLSTVDRDLGRALRDNPRELLNLDGPIQSARTPARPTVGDDDEVDDEDTSGSVDYELEIDVDSYDTDAGFSVTGLRVTVTCRVEWDNEDENPGDPDSFTWSAYVNDDEVLDAIRSADAPTPARWANLSWSESGEWTEA